MVVLLLPKEASYRDSSWKPRYWEVNKLATTCTAVGGPGHDYPKIPFPLCHFRLVNSLDPEKPTIADRVCTKSSDLTNVHAISCDYRSLHFTCNKARYIPSTFTPILFLLQVRYTFRSLTLRTIIIIIIIQKN